MKDGARATRRVDKELHRRQPRIQQIASGLEERRPRGCNTTATVTVAVAAILGVLAGLVAGCHPGLT